MNMQIALRHRSHASWSLGQPGLWWIGLAVLMLLLLGIWMAPVQDTRPGDAQMQPLVRFQDASHDWLMVVDPATHELVVYDADNGRPLRRLGADDGLADVSAISGKGSLLFVKSSRKDPIRVLKLPQLQTVALNTR